jgi:hypothetical protein
LSGEEARQIAENVAGFFSILAEWARDEKPATDARRPAASGLFDAEA